MMIRHDPEKAGKALKELCDRLKNKEEYVGDKPCEEYGCLACRHFQREEGYDQGWGAFAFFYFKCKKQPDRNMYKHDNQYTIFDIKPDYSPNFYYDKAKGKCPYFEQGENELIYMSEEEKLKLTKES